MLSTSVFFLDHSKAFVIFLVQPSTRLGYLDKGLRVLFTFLCCDGRSFSSRCLSLPKAKFVEATDLSHQCVKR